MKRFLCLALVCVILSAAVPALAAGSSGSDRRDPFYYDALSGRIIGVFESPLDVEIYCNGQLCAAGKLNYVPGGTGVYTFSVYVNGYFYADYDVLVAGNGLDANVDGIVNAADASVFIGVQDAFNAAQVLQTAVGL